MKRILYVHSRKASFVAIDRDLLAAHYEIEDLYQPGRRPQPVRVVGGVLRADLVFGWFASWHTFFPITLAWLLRKPSVLIVGGFDTANMPDIGYGYQQGGLRRWASRWIMRRATRLVTNSRYSLGEIERNTPIDPRQVTVIHHGVPDPFGEEGRAKEPSEAEEPVEADEPSEAKEPAEAEEPSEAGKPPASARDRRADQPKGAHASRPVALTVGAVEGGTLVQKGQVPFARAAALLPDVRFVHAGKLEDPEAIAELRRVAAGHVEYTGWVSDADLHGLYRKAAVYVQASRHEGFGLAVAEAMLAGCVPVVMNVTAMPEVVGEAGVLIESQEPAAVADGVRRALDLGPEGGHRARERILAEFPLSRRGEALLAVTAEALTRTAEGRGIVRPPGPEDGGVPDG